jgi:hypothetical protein
LCAEGSRASTKVSRRRCASLRKTLQNFFPDED